MQLFKREYVYDTPKNLVHRTAITKKFKENFEIEEIPVKESSKRYSRVAKLQETSESKRTKIEMIDDYEDYEHFDDLESDQNTEKLEIVFLPIEKEAVVKNSEPQSSSSSELSREEKFIKEVYPQFKGKNKLDLINQILDLERLNEMLQTRAKTYENTINRLLN